MVVLQCNNEGVQKIYSKNLLKPQVAQAHKCAYKLYCYCITLNYRGSGFMSVLLLLLYAVSWWGIEQLGSCFGSIFFLFPIVFSQGSIL